MCLTEKMLVLDKLHLVMSYSAIGCDFNLLNQQYSTSRRRKKKFADLCDATPESTKVTPNVCDDDAMEKKEKHLILWIHEITTGF